jgi:hypothetical protein
VQHFLGQLWAGAQFVSANLKKAELARHNKPEPKKDEFAPGRPQVREAISLEPSRLGLRGARARWLLSG